jgi:hypothetical protein
VAAHLRHSGRGGIQIRADKIAPVLSIKTRGDTGRTHKIAEHHCDMAALANSFRNGRRSRSSGCCRDGWSLHVRIATQSRNCIQQLHTVPKRRDAKLLQVFVR